MENENVPMGLLRAQFCWLLGKRTLVRDPSQDYANAPINSDGGIQYKRK